MSDAMNDERIEIDGGEGEGGGQIFRSSLGLSMVTGRAVRVRNVRAGRKKPGLLRQHLTALEAAREICGAEVEGATLGSREVGFNPGPIRAGNYSFSVGTAGSTTLVLQAVLPALLIADGPSELVIEGGTHNPSAPPFDFLARAFLPLVERMGPKIEATLERHGFFPAGGGRLRLRIEPRASEDGPALRPLHLDEAGEIRDQRARILLSNLPAHVGERERKKLLRDTRWPEEAVHVERLRGLPGPGNVVLIELERPAVTEVFVGFGRRGVSAEAVVSRVMKQVRRYQKAEVPVGEYLADQLLLPMVLAGGGSMLTLPLSRHATTQVDLLRRFVDIPIEVERLSPAQCSVKVGG